MKIYSGELENTRRRKNPKFTVNLNIFNWRASGIELIVDTPMEYVIPYNYHCSLSKRGK